MADRLRAKVAVVVGAGSSGVTLSNGRAIAVTLAREGAVVVAADISLTEAEQTVGQIAESGGRAHGLLCDATQPEAVRQLFQHSYSLHGRIDIVINNVGIAEVSPLAATTDESWSRVIRVNQSSVFLSCREAIPFMLGSGGGSIVNVASVAAVRWLGVPYASYSATKAAVIGMSRNIALEQASRGIRVNCILPGLIDTPMARASLDTTFADEAAFTRSRNERCPMGFMGTPWDVANAALFLASDEARYITATEIVVDGGLTAAVSW